MACDTLQVTLEPGHKLLELSHNSFYKTFTGRSFQSGILSLVVIVLNDKPSFGNVLLHIIYRCIFEVELVEIYLSNSRYYHMHKHGDNDYE